jgi:hypothetical protein
MVRRERERTLVDDLTDARQLVLSGFRQAAYDDDDRGVDQVPPVASTSPRPRPDCRTTRSAVGCPARVRSTTS